jgi:hypothetical protein
MVFSGAAAAAHPGASPDDISMHSPPVTNGTAAATGLNAIAAPHKPAPTAITLTLNRSKIVIDVDPSFALRHSVSS